MAAKVRIFVKRGCHNRPKWYKYRLITHSVPWKGWFIEPHHTSHGDRHAVRSCFPRFCTDHPIYLSQGVVKYMEYYFSHFFCHAAILRIICLIIRSLKRWQMSSSMAAMVKIIGKGHRKAGKYSEFREFYVQCVPLLSEGSLALTEASYCLF